MFVSVSGLSSGLEGVRRGLEGIEESAAEIARTRNDGPDQKYVLANQETGVEPVANESAQGSVPPSTETGRLAEAVVYQKESLLQFQASLAVVRTEQDRLGTLIDLLA